MLCKHVTLDVDVSYTTCWAECQYLSVKSSFPYQDSHVFDILKDLIHRLRRQRLPAGLWMIKMRLGNVTVTVVIKVTNIMITN